MPINANIPLSVQGPLPVQSAQIGERIDKFAGDMLALKTQRDAAAASTAKASALAGKAKLEFDTKEKEAVAKDWIADVTRIDNALENNRPEEAEFIIANRIERVKDPQDSLRLQKLLLSDNPDDQVLLREILAREQVVGAQAGLTEALPSPKTQEVKRGANIETEEFDPISGKRTLTGTARRETRSEREIAMEGLDQPTQDRINRAIALDMKTAEAQAQSVSTASAGATRVSTGASPVDESEYKKFLSRELGKSAIESYEKAKKGVASIGNVREATRLLRDGNVLTGSFAVFRKDIAKFLTTAGIDLGQGNSASDTEAFIVATGKLVADMMGSGMLGAGSALSDADLKFAGMVSANDVNMSLAALIHTLERIEYSSQFLINQHNESFADPASRGEAPSLRVDVPEGRADAPVFVSSVQRALGLAPDATTKEVEDALARMEAGGHVEATLRAGNNVSTRDLRQAPPKPLSVQNDDGSTSIDLTGMGRK